MNLIAMIVLAPTLGYFVADRRRTYAVLVAVWAAILMFQTHLVLLVDQLDDASYSNTAGYFVINYVFLAAGIGIATWLHRRRRRRLTSSPVDMAGTAHDEPARTS